MIVVEPEGRACGSCGGWMAAGQARRHDEHQHTVTCLRCDPRGEQRR